MSLGLAWVLGLGQPGPRTQDPWWLSLLSLPPRSTAATLTRNAECHGERVGVGKTSAVSGRPDHRVHKNKWKKKTEKIRNEKKWSRTVLLGGRHVTRHGPFCVSAQQQEPARRDSLLPAAWCLGRPWIRGHVGISIWKRYLHRPRGVCVCVFSSSLYISPVRMTRGRCPQPSSPGSPCSLRPWSLRLVSVPRQRRVC